MKTLKLVAVTVLLVATCGLTAAPVGATEPVETIQSWVGQIAVSPSETPPAQVVDPGQENVTAVRFVAVSWKESWDLFSVRFTFEPTNAIVERIALYDSTTGEVLAEPVSLPEQGVMIDFHPVRRIHAGTVWRFEARVDIKQYVVPGQNVRIGIRAEDDVVASGAIAVNGPQMGFPLTVRGTPFRVYVPFVAAFSKEPPPPLH